MTLNFVGEMQVLLRQWKVTSINGTCKNNLYLFEEYQTKRDLVWP